MVYQVHTADTAPAAARETLEAARAAYGFIPNLLGIMAEAPAMVKAYVALSRLFNETSLSPAERIVVLLTASSENECTYCVAAHTITAEKQKVPDPVVQAIRNNQAIPDGRLEALRRYTSAVISRQGWPTSADTAAFEAAGYTNQQAIEVVLGIGMKILTSYVNHVAHTPLDSAFAKAEWSIPA